MEKPRVLGVLAGTDYQPEVLRRWIDSASVVMAADRGADLVQATGAIPHYLVGDLDSVSSEVRAMVSNIRHDADQESTDVDKLLALAQELGFEGVTLTNVEGGLFDHTLHTVHAASKSPLEVRLALRSGLAWLIRGGRSWQGQFSAGRRISLLPITELHGVSMEGVRWEPRKHLHPLGFTSISNQTVGGPVSVDLESGVGLLFVRFDPEELPIW